MGKLGKKARKFAKKHLQSVLRHRRKTKALFSKKNSKGGQNDVEEQVDNPVEPSNGRVTDSEAFESISLDAAFLENDEDGVEDASDSDGYLSEDSSCPHAVETESGNTLEDEISKSTYSAQNEELRAEIAILNKKLDRLKKKAPEFSKLLESKTHESEEYSDDEYSDEGDTSDEGEEGEDASDKDKSRLLTNHLVNTWCKMVKEEHNQSALISLLNGYRAACHYGAESIGHRIENSETFSSILLFVLSNADSIFRALLEISSPKLNKETLLQLKKTSKWKSLKPLVKSYVRSTLFLLNQITDANTLALAMTKIRASLIFFLAFPSLMQRLIKASVHLWATGGSVLSSASFLVIRDVSSMFTSNYFSTCLSKSFVAFLSNSRVTEIADIKQMQFMRDCIVELCSLDASKSSLKAVASIEQLTKILRWGIQTKKKEHVKKICSWEYVNCIDVWVRFIAANVRDFDLHSSFYTTVQLINGVAHLFPGPRYFPLRLKCIEWLNLLSGSNGTFIPVAALVLDILEYKVVKEGRKATSSVNVASVLKLPKHYLKSRSFQEERFHSALEQLSLHFSQWSYHISFPDLATIPLIRLRKIHEFTTIESLRRLVKRLVEQVEQNVDFVRRKRDEASFSPHDHQSVESFLQLEKPSLNTPFGQYYRSVLDKATERSMHKYEKKSLPEQNISKRNNRAKLKRKNAAANGLHMEAEDQPVVENGVVHTKRKKGADKVQ